VRVFQPGSIAFQAQEAQPTVGGVAEARLPQPETQEDIVSCPAKAHAYDDA